MAKLPSSLLLSSHTEAFKKLGISSLSELALIAPYGYEDYRQPFIEDKRAFLEVTIEAVIPKEKITIIEATSSLLPKIELIFFKFLSYHRSLFALGNKLFVTGRYQHYPKPQIIQPKVVANYKIGKIVPLYKTPLRADIFFKLTQELLSAKNLQNEGLPLWVAEALECIHHPDELFLKEYRKRGVFWGDYLRALKFTEIFLYLKKLRSKRRFVPSLCQIKKDITPFLEKLPFQLTKDQLKVISDIQKDLQKKIAARRVIVGDVGSGKSMVMFATAFLSQKAILMAPTTILANQLYEEAKKYLDLKIALVTNKEKPPNLENFDFIIGTHALLYQKLPKACVVMVDEQHRFGTEQRQLLKRLVQNEKGSPHFFQFSATPIPRTQALIQSALVDFSFIKQTPFKKDITTKVIGKEDFKELLAHIQREIAQKRQVLIVYPLVEESEHFAYKSLEEAKNFWQKYFDGVFITHGKDKDKDEVLKEFRDNGNILLATTVVEVGISLPRLSTIVIVGAEHMGLATLHQLRGRVSRTGLKGYCFLYTKDKNNKRLLEFSKIKSGFEVAKLDLIFRRSGDIVEGKEQSGKTFKWFSMAFDEDLAEEAKKILAQ